MKFFASWTSRDPCFQDYDKECKLMVSPANVPSNWGISKWDNLPKELFVDSGAFSITYTKTPDCKDILDRQLFLAKGWNSDKRLLFSHPDILIPIKADFRETTNVITDSLERAKIYFGLLAKMKLNIIPVGVIHGFDEETLLLTYDELKKIGYSQFALGSMSVRFRTHRNLCFKVIELVRKYDIKPLHLFGITWPLVNEGSSVKFASFDSSASSKLAFNGTVLYGLPLKRYVISPDAKQKFHIRCFRFRKGLAQPLPCACPICSIDSRQLIPKYGREAKRSRAIHNYFQIKWAIEAKV